ncbi:MAG: type VI secretion system baseplate subunit TssE [Polyangiales bacterium]
MPEFTHKERLQPSLLDRLTDDEPDVRVEGRDKRILSQERLRASVLRDLTWLFNTTHMSALVDLARHPEVAKSVLNYGLPDLAGHTATGVDVPQLEQLLRKAIWHYEPRLVQRSVRVHLIVDPNQMNHNSMRFEIEAELFAQPLPLQLYLRTEIDLEDGDVRVAMRETPLSGRPVMSPLPERPTYGDRGDRGDRSGRE